MPTSSHSLTSGSEPPPVVFSSSKFVSFMSNVPMALSSLTVYRLLLATRATTVPSASLSSALELSPCSRTREPMLMKDDFTRGGGGTLGGGVASGSAAAQVCVKVLPIVLLSWHHNLCLDSECLFLLHVHGEESEATMGHISPTQRVLIP